MCVVSNIGDSWRRGWGDRPISPAPAPFAPAPAVWPFGPGVSQADFDTFKRRIEQDLEGLKAEMENLKKLLQLGKAIDDAAGAPDCEMDEKVALIKAVAEAVGVDMGDVFK